MSTTPFAWNTGSSIVGTETYGELSVATSSVEQNFGGVTWIKGAQELNQYLIGHATQSFHLGSPSPIRYWGTGSTTPEFISLSQQLTYQEEGLTPQIFSNGSQAYTYLINNGYWTNYTITPIDPEPGITASTSPTAPWWGIYTPYSNTVYADNIFTTDGAIVGVAKYTGSNQYSTGSLPVDLNGYVFRSYALNSDGSKIFVGLTSWPDGGGSQWQKVGVIDVATDTIITASLDIPGTSSAQGTLQWQFNSLSHDSVRNEFLILSTGYATEGSGSELGYQFSRILRFDESCSLQGYYYPYTPGLLSTQNYPIYNATPKYNPNDDCIYTVASYSTASSPSTNHQIIVKHDITSNTNSLVYSSFTSQSGDPSGKSDKTWWNFYTTLIPETNEFWLDNYYYSSSGAGRWVDIQTFNLNTNTLSTLFTTKSISDFYINAQNNWAYDNNSEIIYTFQNSIQAWDVVNKTLLLEITQSTQPNGLPITPVPYNNKLYVNTTTQELIVSYTSGRYINVFDVSNL